jgi:hypothetical protein
MKGIDQLCRKGSNALALCTTPLAPAVIALVAGPECDSRRQPGGGPGNQVANVRVKDLEKTHWGIIRALAVCMCAVGLGGGLWPSKGVNRGPGLALWLAASTGHFPTRTFIHEPLVGAHKGLHGPSGVINLEEALAQSVP